MNETDFVEVEREQTALRGGRAVSGLTVELDDQYDFFEGEADDFTLLFAKRVVETGDGGLRGVFCRWDRVQWWGEHGQGAGGDCGATNSFNERGYSLYATCHNI